MCFHLKSNQVSVKQWHCRGILRSRMYRLNLSFFRKHYIIHVIIMALHKCKYTSIRRGEKKSITNIAKNVWMKVTVGRQKGSIPHSSLKGFPCTACRNPSMATHKILYFLVVPCLGSWLLTLAPSELRAFKLLLHIQPGAYKKGKLGMGVGEMNENELSVIQVLKTVSIFFAA